MRNRLLTVKDLSTSFFGDNGEVKAVDNISFTVRKGEILGVVGESGCGKSVTSLSIMGLLKDTSGKITNGTLSFLGQNLRDLTDDQMRQIRGHHMAMIFQEPMTSLNPVIRIGEQIEEAIRVHLNLPHQAAQKRVIEMLDQVGIPRAEAIYHEYPHQLSGGMRQRVMIALAMSCNPKLLIADEPTTALDVTIQAQILALMRDLKDRHQMAILLITHDLSVVAQMCDGVMVMYAGKVMEQADVYTMFDNPLHPYTQGLYRSLPRLDQDVKRLDSIKGMVPTLSRMPKGCRFAPRCNHVTDACWQKIPPLKEVAPSHWVRCWLYSRTGQK